MSEYDMTTTEITIKPKGEELFHNMATKVSLDSEGDGAFLVLSQCRDDSNGDVRIDPEEWPVVCEAVGVLLAEIRKMDGEK